MKRKNKKILPLPDFSNLFLSFIKYSEWFLYRLGKNGSICRVYYLTTRSNQLSCKLFHEFSSSFHSTAQLLNPFSFHELNEFMIRLEPATFRSIGSFYDHCATERTCPSQIAYFNCTNYHKSMDRLFPFWHSFPACTSCISGNKCTPPPNYCLLSS